MLAYSALTKKANRIPLYSVKNPATSSLSASGRSNGIRLVSATAEMMKTTKAKIWVWIGKNPSGRAPQMNQCQNPPAWASVIATRLREPDNSSTPTMASPTFNS